jgi:hypothetical protein
MDTFNPKSLKAIDLEIQRLTEKLKDEDPTNERYAMINNNIKELCEARSKYDQAAINPNVVLQVAVNLIGLLVILNFEKTGTITSKALSFLGRK